MDSAAILPSYDKKDTQPPGYPPEASNSPPPYTFPTSFQVGLRRVAPFVNINELKAHLRLLKAFAELKAQVVLWEKDEQIPLMPMDPERRWTWFVGLAVERCEVCCSIFDMRADDGKMV